MLQITLKNKAYGLPYGTHVLGDKRYIVDCRGIVAQDKFYNTRNIYTDNSVSGQTEDEKMLHEIEVKAVIRGIGTAV